MTSVTRWLVRTLPPTTAASGLGHRMLFSGILISTGRRQPCATSGNIFRDAGEADAQEQRDEFESPALETTLMRTFNMMCTTRLFAT